MSMKNAARLGAVLAGTALVATGCLSDGGGGADGGGGEGESTGDGRVEIVGAFSGVQEQAFVADLEAVAEATGLEVSYTSLADFETVIISRVAGNNAPDIAIFPQPGLLLDLASSGEIIPLADALDVDAASADMIDGLVQTGSDADGTTFGLPYSISVKSLVWYPQAAFPDGIEVPASHQELVALSQQIADDGTTPWCLGIQSDAATGWVATDWIEDYVLRVGGPDVYDQWVAHEIPFDDPVVVEAANAFAEIALTDGFVYGGVEAITNVAHGDSSLPFFTDPPGCSLHRQATFVTGYWPEEVTSDLSSNVGLFLLPPYEGGYDGQPVLGGGDFMSLFDASNSEAAEVLAAIAAPSFGENSAGSGQWLSPNRSFDSSFYANEILAEQAELAASADVFRFDGSDLMPGEVGTGTFWTGMVEWLSGQKDIETVLAEIDASWPAN